ncbi:hypothetical protein OQH60_08410 [Campylobacter sp. MIT 21-1685]|uniref:hypothetical protein n=1 Tax=unclassified Campylobacter TaxID=2593542 RepID=UPI00224A5523|nr:MULTISPECIES: hypothetical protein [unclassified Campylobacter]MCX2683875.1 hypothetical protein [Campylobacter sp. MIT 21-1684]MCX2752159.1 hypothetical protein [Campylobacter sp. MIT 21-1682]MCX2808355.1 hypothetical protein [Campylobacter sp. MIT 21-1685]
MFRVVLLILVALSLNAGFYEEKPKPATQNCKVICEKCGFFVSQTNDYLDEYKASYENEDDFYIVMDDWIHYLFKTEDYLKVNGIEANLYGEDIKECPTLTFGEYSLEVSKIDSYFIFILYEKGKKPYVIQDIVLSEDEINTYFNITNPKYYKERKGEYYRSE